MRYLPLHYLIENNILLEKTRKELLQKQKHEAPKRVKRAEQYSVTSVAIDPDAFLNDWLVITTTISGNSRSYTDQIAFKGVMTDLIEVAKNDSSHTVNSKLIIKSIHASLDKNDIYINCTCPDFKFTYQYWASKGKFCWGKLQNSNGKEIRNPNNDKGCMCKHLYALLRSNKFLNAISDKIMRTIMANLDVLFKRFEIEVTEFKVNTAAYDRMLQMNIKRDKSGRFQKNVPEENEKEDSDENNENNNEST